MAETLVISGDVRGLAYIVAAALLLALGTFVTARRWRRGQALLMLVLLDLYMAVIELPSRLTERVVVTGRESVSLRWGRWYNPVEIYLPLADINVVYELERSRHWWEREVFWLFQNSRFRRKRLYLPPLLRRQRQRVAEFLETQGIPVIDHQSLDLSKPLTL